MEKCIDLQRVAFYLYCCKKRNEMSTDKLTKESIIQQLNCLSKQYEELLKLLDEKGNLIQQHTTPKPRWVAFFKRKDLKKRLNNTLK